MAHLHGVALAAAILAMKRGQNAELATMAGMLHDLWAYKSGSYDDHAHLGADYARKVLEELTTPEETEIICSAIYHHLWTPIVLQWASVTIGDSGTGFEKTAVIINRISNKALLSPFVSSFFICASYKKRVRHICRTQSIINWNFSS